MRKIKKIFKYLSYSLLFLIIAIGSAYGVITMSLNNAANKSNKSAGTAESQIPEEITSIVNNFMTSDAIEANLQVDVSSAEQDICITINNGKVDLSNGIDNLVVNADISVKMLSLNNQIELGFYYEDGCVYLDGFNNKFKLETKNLLSSIENITSLLNIEMPSLGGLDMGALDMNALLGTLKVSNEKQTENGISLDIEIPAVGASINLQCDKDYKLQNLNIPTIEFNGISISVNGQLDYPNEVVIKELVKDEYINLSSALDYTKNLKSLIKKPLAFNYTLNYLGSNFDGEMVVDLEQLRLMANIDLGETKPTLLLIDNVLYVEIGNLYLKFALADIEKLQPILDNLNIAFPLREVTNLLNQYKANGIEALIGLLGKAKFDLTNIDLSVLSNIASSEQDLEITIENLGTISLKSNENGIESASIKSSNLSLSLRFTEAREFKLNKKQSQYFDLSTLLPFAEKLSQIIGNKYVDGNAVINYKGLNITANYKAIFDQNLFVEANINLLGKDISLIYKDKQVFVAFSNTFIKLNTANLQEILNQISNNFDVDLADTLSNVLAVFDQSKSALMIRSFIQRNDGVELKLAGGSRLFLTSQDSKVEIKLIDENLNITGSLNSASNVIVSSVEEDRYVDVEKLLPTIANITNYIINQKLYLKYSATATDLAINGGFNLDKNNLLFVCNLNYKGVQGTIGISNGKIYLTVENMNFAFDLSDFDKVKTLLLNHFNVDLNQIDQTLIEKTGISISEIIAFANGERNLKIKQPSLNDILNIVESYLGNIEIELTPNYLNVVYNDLNACLNFNNNMITDASLSYNDMRASLSILNKPYSYKFNKQYVDLGKIVTLVDDFMSYIEEGKIAIGANFNSSNGGSITANAQIDKTQTFRLSAEISSTLKEHFDASIEIENETTYLNLNGILLKLSNKSFKEILFVALELFNINANAFDMFKNVNMNMDLTELKRCLPNMDTSEALDIIKMVKSFKKVSNNYVIKFDGSKLLNNQNASNITLTIKTNGARLVAIKVENLYTSSLNECFNGEITFNNLLNIKNVNKDLSYIDISNSSELVKAIVNMSKIKTFNIKGDLDLQGNLIGIKINKSVGFDIKINITNDHKIEVYGVIGAIPTLIGVNNDVPYAAGDTNSGSNRYLSFYYKDGYVYLYRSEKIHVFFGAGSRSYEKCVKVSLSTLLNDPLKFLQYGIGFTDSIMDEIKASSQKAKNREKPMDFSKIISSFTSTKTSYNLELNMAEILNNKDIDKLSISLKLLKDGNSKSYISGATFNLSIPLSKAFSLKLSSNNIKLTNYGGEIDMSQYYSYTSNYKYAEGEYWEASKGDWKMAGQTTTTITFETNSHYVLNTITNKAGTHVDLPVLNSYSFRNGDYKTYRTFAGWYTDANLKNKFEQSIMPGFDLTLYAKWDERVERVYTYEDLII